MDVVHKFRHSTTGVMVTKTLRVTSPIGNITWTREQFMGDPVENATLQPYHVVDVTRTPGANNTETVREMHYIFSVRMCSSS
jgi:hypothetical protein